MGILPVWISPFCQIFSCDGVLPNERTVLSVNVKCKKLLIVNVNSIEEALTNMVYELRITSGSKKLCKTSMVIRPSIKELLAKNSVLRPLKYIVITYYKLEHIINIVPSEENQMLSIQPYQQHGPSPCKHMPVIQSLKALKLCFELLHL